jgi:acyl carrier protein
LFNPIYKEQAVSEDKISILAKYIAEDFLRQPNRVINPTEPLLSTGLIDSFHLVDLGLFVEDTFGVRIDDSELNASTFDNLNQLVALIESRL